MNAIALLIVGIVLLIVLYFVPQIPPPVRTVGNIIGWICVVVGALLIILAAAGLVGPVTVP